MPVRLARSELSLHEPRPQRPVELVIRALIGYDSLLIKLKTTASPIKAEIINLASCI